MRLKHNWRKLMVAAACVFVLGASVSAQDKTFSTIENLFAARDYDAAIKRLNEMTVPASLEVEKYQYLAKAYLETGAGIAAETAIERARRLGADYAVTAVSYAKSLLIQGRYAESQTSLRGVIIPDAFLGESYVILGDSYFAMGKVDDAGAQYEKAKIHNPDDYQPYLGLARLKLRTGNLEAAAMLAQDAAKRADHNTMVQYTLGLISRYQGDVAQSEAYFEKAIALYEGNIMANIELASIRITQNRVSDAEELLDKVYEVSHNQPMALYLSAVIEASRGNFEQASALLSRTKQLSDTYLPAVYVKGMVAYELGRNDVAIEALTKVMAVRPDNRAARLALASSYTRFGKPFSALKTLQPILDSGDADANVLTIAAAAAMTTGDADLGKKYYAEANKLKGEGQKGGIAGLGTKLALAEYATGDTERALATLSSVIAGSEVDLRELGLMGSMQIREKKYSAAKETIDRILKIAPNRALGYNMKGTLEFKQKNFSGAVVSYTRALDLSDEYYTARRNRGLSYMRLEKFKEARADLKGVLAAKPDDVLTKAALAKTLLLMGEAEESVDYFREAIRLLPKSLRLAEDYAEALAQSGNTARAIEQARKAAVMAQDEPETLKRMGLLLLRLGEARAAERPLSRYVAYNPHSGEAHLMHGRAMLQTGLYTGATLSFKRASNASTNRPDPDIMTWYLFAAEAGAQHYNNARDRLKQLIPTKRPADIDPSVVGNLLFSMGQFEEAEAAYRSVLQEDNSSSAVIGLANTLSKQSKGAEAIKLLQQYLKNKPDDRLVVLALAQRLETKGDYENASKQYEQLLRIGVADANIAARLAHVYLQLGNNRSIRLASSAHLMSPDDPYVLDVYGWVMLQAGRNTEDSIIALKKAVRRSPSNALYHYHLGMAYLARGQRYEAKDMLIEAIGLDPNFPGAAEARRQLGLLE